MKDDWKGGYETVLKDCWKGGYETVLKDYWNGDYETVSKDCWKGGYETVLKDCLKAGYETVSKDCWKCGYEGLLERWLWKTLSEKQVLDYNYAFSSINIKRYYIISNTYIQKSSPCSYTPQCSYKTLYHWLARN